MVILSTLSTDPTLHSYAPTFMYLEFYPKSSMLLKCYIWMGNYSGNLLNDRNHPQKVIQVPPTWKGGFSTEYPLRGEKVSHFKTSYCTH